MARASCVLARPGSGRPVAGRVRDAGASIGGGGDSTPVSASSMEWAKKAGTGARFSRSVPFPRTEAVASASATHPRGTEGAERRLKEGERLGEMRMGSGVAERSRPICPRKSAATSTRAEARLLGPACFGQASF